MKIYVQYEVTMGTEELQIDLSDRFIHSIRYVNEFLKMTGVDLIPRNLTKKNLIRRWIWSGFWMLLNTQSGIFIIIRRKSVEMIITLLSSSALLLSDGRLTDHLNEAIMRFSTFIFETFTHYDLVWSIRPILRRFFDKLAFIDAELGRPSLSSIRDLSIASLVFTLLIVIIYAFV